MGSENFGDDETNFNEAELQDIMSEIENLEKEFSSHSASATADTPATSATAATEVTEVTEATEAFTSHELEKAFGFNEHANEGAPKTLTLQEKIEAELQEELAKEKTRQEEQEKMSKIVKLRPDTNAMLDSNLLSNPGEIYFNALGPMCFNLSFKIGADIAQLSIDPKNGLKITMKGIELTVSEGGGYSFLMENGAKLTIPVGNANQSQNNKKAS